MLYYKNYIIRKNVIEHSNTLFSLNCDINIPIMEIFRFYYFVKFIKFNCPEKNEISEIKKNKIKIKFEPNYFYIYFLLFFINLDI